MRKVFIYIGDMLLTAICLVGIGYNVLIGLNSEEGARMKTLLEKEIAVEQVRLETLQAEHTFLNNRADLLLSKSLDKDLLEERVRSVLGLAHHEEFMVRLSDLDQMLETPAPKSRDVPEHSAPDDVVRLAAADLPLQQR